MRFAAVVLGLVAVANPALAFETEEIGTLQATFDGESIVQPTVIAKSEDETSATAFLAVIGGGMSSLSLAGYTPDNKRLGIDATYMVEEPGPESVPIDLTITYVPEGTAEHWTSEEAPTPASITFTTFEADGDEGRVVGTFTAVLCHAEDYGSGADPDNCHPIEGSFDTRFFVER